MKTNSKYPIEQQLLIRHLGVVEYELVLAAMQQFTDRRDNSTVDELWWVQHPSVFTQGQAGKPEHLLSTGDIRVVQSDRGGQVTYHGLGQLIGYLMINLKRRHLGVRELVTAIEQALIAVLAKYDISTYARKEAPGIYVDSGAKIAQLGLRVRRGSSFHGLSLNVDMDLAPFLGINPCGFKGLAVTSMAKESTVLPNMQDVLHLLGEQLSNDLGYTDCHNLLDGVLPV